jgi:hypothetical protein
MGRARIQISPQDLTTERCIKPQHEKSGGLFVEPPEEKTRSILQLPSHH